MKKVLLALILLSCTASARSQATPVLGKDWKKAIWRAPLHIAMSAPVAAATVAIPPIGKAYVRWRVRAEEADVTSGSDTSGKAAIDLYSQTALPRAILKLYRIQVQ